MNGSKSDRLHGRRQFLKFSGIAAVASVATAACNKRVTTGVPDTIDIGEGSVGAMNLLFAIEQFNAALLARILSKPYPEMSLTEVSFLTDMRDHDIAHRDFLKTLLGNEAIPDILLDLDYVDFSSRAKTLAAAQQLKDLAVSAYNSAAYLFGDAGTLSCVFKMASVDARHSSLVGNLLSFGSFADASILNDYSLEKTLSIPMVLQTINLHLKKRLSAKAFSYMPY